MGRRITDYSAATVSSPRSAANVARGATLKTDGWAAYPGTSELNHDRYVVGTMAQLGQLWRGGGRLYSGRALI